MKYDFNPLKERSALHRSIRQYFHHRGFLEVDTPILAASPIPESHIELFKTLKKHPESTSKPLYLLPSPELWLKQILASGSPPVFQIGKCFRNGEQLDRWHRNEFTMLEWYDLHKTSSDNLSIMQDIINLAVETIRPDYGTADEREIRVISMNEAFLEHAGFSLESDLVEAGLAEDFLTPRDYRAALKKLSQTFKRRLLDKNLPAGDDKEAADDLFHRLFLTLVEDNLPDNRPLALTRWPAFIPTLARNLPGTPWADRWELYIRGIETANCYGEETDEDKLINFWHNETAKINDERVSEEAGMAWVRLISRGMPPCSGTAVGMDRLHALIRGDEGLEGLDLFPIHDNMPGNSKQNI